MPTAKLKPKHNSVFITVANPPANSKSFFRDVRGAFMEHPSQENIESWWGIFCEMYDECADTPRHCKRIVK